MAQREQLRAAFEALDAEQHVRIVVVRALGRAFFQWRRNRRVPRSVPRARVAPRLEHRRADALSQPVIAASRGYCFGVGFELALACDFRVVSETRLYALPEQRLGQILGSGGAARLQKMVGIARAKDIVMRSRRLGGRQAYEWGVATECVADGELEAAAG